MTINMNEYVIRDSNNSILLEETLEKFQKELMEFISEDKSDYEFIGAAVNSVFDKNPNVLYNMDLLVWNTMTELGAMTENVDKVNAFKKRIKEYIRLNSGTRESGKLFNEAWKGKGKGIVRWTDRPDWDDTPKSKQKK